MPQHYGMRQRSGLAPVAGAGSVSPIGQAFQQGGAALAPPAPMQGMGQGMGQPGPGQQERMDARQGRMDARQGRMDMRDDRRAQMEAFRRAMMEWMQGRPGGGDPAARQDWRAGRPVNPMRQGGGAMMTPGGVV